MSQSTAARLMLADDSGISSNAIMQVFDSTTLAGQRTIVRHAGHRGTRQRASCRARITSDKSAGAIVGRMSVDEIDWWIPRAIGTTGSSPWVPGESMAAIYALVDKVARIYLYNGLRVTSWEVSGSETQHLVWTFNLLGALEETYGSSWPVSPVPTCGTSFLFSDCVFTYASTAYAIKSFKLSVDNMIDEQQYENSITPSRFEAQDLAVTLDIECALRSDTLALYRAALAGGTASLAISDGTTTYTFNFANIKQMTGAPTVPENGRITMPLQFEAFRSASTGTASTDNVLRIVKT